MIAIPGGITWIGSRYFAITCPTCGVAIRDVAAAVTVTVRLKKEKSAPRLEPPEPSTWPPPRLMCTAMRDNPRPAVTRKQPRMRAEARKVEGRIKKLKEV